MSVESVAQEIGISKATLSRYENGKIKIIPPENVHRLANLFGVSRPYLMGWTDEPQVNPHENLDVVAENLGRNLHDAMYKNIGYWEKKNIREVDCTTAATQAARALIKFGITKAPIYPHKVFQQTSMATMITFSNMSEIDKILLNSKLSAFVSSNNMVLSAVYPGENNKDQFLFAVKRDAPMGKIRLALAVELGHLYLGHRPRMAEQMRKRKEAECFAVHFEYPRALIRLLQEKEFVFTEESFQMIFGDCEWCLDSILQAEPVSVSPELNRMVKELFVPYVNILEETGVLGVPVWEKEMNLENYMAGYQD